MKVKIFESEIGSPGDVSAAEISINDWLANTLPADPEGPTGAPIAIVNMFVDAVYNAHRLVPAHVTTYIYKELVEGTTGTYE